MVAVSPYLGDRSRSPIVAASIASITCAFVAVGILASYLPRSAPMGWSVAFLVLAALLFVSAVILLTRHPGLPWALFWRVARWVSVLPAVFAATAIFVFISDGTSGSTLAIMVAVLLLAAVNIPLVVAFSVVRHQSSA